MDATSPDVPNGAGQPPPRPLSRRELRALNQRRRSLAAPPAASGKAAEASAGAPKLAPVPAGSRADNVAPVTPSPPVKRPPSPLLPPPAAPPPSRPLPAERLPPQRPPAARGPGRQSDKPKPPGHLRFYDPRRPPGASVPGPESSGEVLPGGAPEAPSARPAPQGAPRPAPKAPDDGQQCPWCERWALKDSACNHVVCGVATGQSFFILGHGCGRQFCFSCGLKLCALVHDPATGHSAGGRTSHDAACCRGEVGFIEKEYCPGGHNSHCPPRW